MNTYIKKYVLAALTIAAFSQPLTAASKPEYSTDKQGIPAVYKLFPGVPKEELDKKLQELRNLMDGKMTDYEPQIDHEE